ncbi:serine--tRNA ligase [Elusimicrobiota bacterium]
MNDPRLLRKDPDRARRGVKDRGGRHLPLLERFLERDAGHRALLAEVELMRAGRNESSKAIGKAKAGGDEELAGRLMREVAETKRALAGKEDELSICGREIRDLLLSMPNLPDESVPVGLTEETNREVRSSGEVPEPSFKPRDHAALGESLGILDFETAAKLSGSRFVIVKGAGARLQRAVGQFMIDTHVDRHGYTEMWVPHVVRPEICEGTGQLPKFEQDLYRTGQVEEAEGGSGKSDSYYLIPTAEVPLTNLVRERILDEDALPMKVTALTPCYRQEAGSYGKDVHGMIRQHQFDKVELVWVTKPEDSMSALEELTTHAESVLKELGLPYRILELCTGELGFASRKTYDLEVWMPGEKRWREVSSCSNCWDFQARRMNARFRRGRKGGPELVHTLNGSGLAVGRIFAAVLENFQREDGSISVPEPLRKYFGRDTLLAS